jgi:serralysin
MAGKDPVIRFGTNGYDDLQGGEHRDWIYGRGGHDVLRGLGGHDLLKGGSGDDFLAGGEGRDRIYGGRGEDTASFGGTSGVVVDLRARGWQDSGEGLDKLRGIENLVGTIGADTFIAGYGANSFDGGPGDDQFVFKCLCSFDGDSVYKLRGSGFDRIDISAIDADTTQVGDQAFTLVGAFDGHAGQAVWSYVYGASSTTLQLDVDGDGAADGELTVGGNDFGNIGFVL